MKRAFLVLLIVSLLATLPPKPAKAWGATANQIYTACIVALIFEASKPAHRNDPGYLERGRIYCGLLADEIDREANGQWPPLAPRGTLWHPVARHSPLWHSVALATVQCKTAPVVGLQIERNI